VPPQDPTACRWCSTGAIYAEPLSKARNEARDALGAAARETFHGYGVVDVNDQLGHAAVLRMFDVAIARTETA